MASEKNRLTSDAAVKAVLENSTRLRIASTVVLLLIWYFAIQAPMSGKIERDSRRLDVERDRVDLAGTIEHLDRQAARVADRLSPDSDQNEWLAFLLDRVRSNTLKLVSLEPKPPLDVGHYQVVTFRLSVEGDFAELEKLLRDLETSRRLIRIETVKIAPRNNVDVPVAKAGPAPPEKLEMNLTVLGVVHPPAAAKPESAGSEAKS